MTFLFPALALAQFSDDFGDGNFTTDPVWHGETGKFIVEDGTLRLNDQAAGTAWLSTQNSIVENTRWEFWVRLAFTPSNNNHPRIYLVSDSQDLSGPLNGYYIRIGKDGGDNKRLYFYRQDGTVHTEIMAGNTNLAAATNNRLRIRATRDTGGNWEFFADAQGNFLFVPQGTVNDTRHTLTSWFGMYCLYTVSNSNRFYFDDFAVGEIVEDTEPPEVSFLQLTASNMLNVHFNEVVEPASAGDISNYWVDSGIGHPMIASPDPLQPNMVSLMFSGNFAENHTYNLQVKEVKDLYGNALTEYNGQFVLYRPRPFDVVFNELMVNPTPAVGLPAFEYLELYNTTNFPVNLEGWIFQHGNTRRTLPSAPLPAKGYLLLVTETAYPNFRDFGNVVGVPGLSSTALTNAGSDLLLFDKEERLVSFVSYSDQWYKDPARSNGGWSLEKIDPYNFCQGMDNWRASADPRGGTPAAPNSVMGNNPDVSAPGLLRAGFENNQTIVLFFSETMHTATLENTANYQMDQGMGQPLAAVPLMPDFSGVRLTFEKEMQAGIVYQISLSQGITDCAGNALDKRTARVAVPVTAEQSDVVINEVLFNPPDGGARYIELYNRSEKVIDLKDCLIASKDTTAGFLTTIQEISSQSYLFFPEDYVVLTTSPPAVMATFMTPNPEGFLRVAAMPRMTNANGIVVFATKSLSEIDMFVYDEDMQFALLTTNKGVSLERLNPDRPTQDRSNWHSASQGSGFGTPAYLNSQFTRNEAVAIEQVEVYPEVFSPDGDGTDDLLNIAYSFSDPGFVANVRVFDSRGRQIRYVARGELLSTSGIITWDGIADNGQKAPVGIYLVHMEVFDLHGKVRNFRKTAVLGGRL